MQNYDEWKLDNNEPDDLTNDCMCGEPIEADEEYCSTRCRRADER